MQNNGENKQVYAGFFVRLAAYCIDWIIIGLLLFVVRIPMWIVSLGGGDFIMKDFFFHYSLYDIVLYCLKALYFILLTYYGGATFGKRIMQIRVISKENRKLTLFEVVFRETVGKFLSGIILCIGYFMIGADKEKKGLHDILSDTRVVYYHEKKIAVPTLINYQNVPYAKSVTPVFYNNPNGNYGMNGAGTMQKPVKNVQEETSTVIQSSAENAEDEVLTAQNPVETVEKDANTVQNPVENMEKDATTAQNPMETMKKDATTAQNPTESVKNQESVTKDMEIFSDK